MLKENTGKYDHFHQHNFLVRLFQKHNEAPLEFHFNNEKRSNIRAFGSNSICWILCSLFVKLLFIDTSIVDSSAIANSVVISPVDASAAKAVSSAKTISGNKPTVSKRSDHTALSALEKEVVERLIKEWAAIVWLAPEEQFMPLGVEEFLAHVHTENKDNTFTHGMLFGGNTEKSFLVTNIEIEKLLENSTSFIYGRNPNTSPVPIYALVTICNRNHKEKLRQDSEHTLTSEQLVVKKLSHFQSIYSYQPLETDLQKGFNPTRGPYIPITLSHQKPVQYNLRSSSRLYPMFYKIKRSLTHLSNTSPVPIYGLVMRESLESFPTEKIKISDSVKFTEEPKNNMVNNFIANLVDNVKFSTPFDVQGVVEKENEPQMSRYVNNEGFTIPSFHVTYWMFYPYSQGKNMCTLNLGPFGRIPFPAVYGFCLGRKKDIGSHIGDWEHMTLYFTGSAEPEAMYVSAHDAGAYYAYDRLTGSFEFKSQETRKGILQKPNFPKTVTTFNNHPVLFAAKGSHGLWTAPGKHRFVKVARLYDINGFGTPWNTWKHIQITYENLKSYGRAFVPTWLAFKGKWGNPKSKCHPLRRIGLNFCEFSDGPTGIPLKEQHFQCDDIHK